MKLAGDNKRLYGSLAVEAARLCISAAPRLSLEPSAPNSRRRRRSELRAPIGPSRRASGGIGRVSSCESGRRTRRPSATRDGAAAPRAHARTRTHKSITIAKQINSLKRSSIQLEWRVVAGRAAPNKGTASERRTRTMAIRLVIMMSREQATESARGQDTARRCYLAIERQLAGRGERMLTFV